MLVIVPAVSGRYVCTVNIHKKIKNKSMKKNVGWCCLLISLSAGLISSGCTKSSGSSGGSSGSGRSGSNSSPALMPLALNNSWNYKLKTYDPNSGAVTDSSYFTLSITGEMPINGLTYFQFQNSVDNTTVPALASSNTSTLEGIDSAYGISYYTFFVSGTGDSTESVSEWPVAVSSNGAVCQGTDKLYAFYADTTLVNNDGLTYTHAMKNVILTYNCSGGKSIANVYFIKQGIGIVRYSRYTYNSSGQPLLELAWVLESQTLH
jgi:hypothetical protein